MMSGLGETLSGLSPGRWQRSSGTHEVRMAPEQTTLEQVVEFARQLTPREKAQLIAQLIPDVEAMLAQVDAERKPLRSVYG